MLESFLSYFQQDDVGDGNLAHVTIRSVEEIIPLLGGRSFNGGLYRIHASKQAMKWNSIVAGAFSQFSSQIRCFGYDWLGRQFALDKTRAERGRPQVLLFQIGMGEVFEIPRDIVDFHDYDLVHLAEAALEVNLYETWRKAGNPALSLSQCAGYKVPPFLGGRDEIGNLMLTDMEVEWSMTGQLLMTSSMLPKGAQIDKVQIRE